MSNIIMNGNFDGNLIGFVNSVRTALLVSFPFGVDYNRAFELVISA